MMKFHFSGICGSGMGNVAMLIKSLGHEVKGSDLHAFPPMSTILENEGIKVLEGYSEENVLKEFEPDVQVIANVLPRSNAECALAEKSEWKMVSFPEVIENWILPGRDSYVVAGTHGKTTTSSLLAQMLELKETGSLIGGIMQNGNAGCRLGDPKGPFVIEGDEYDTAWFDKHSKFLHYSPKYLILTHLEWDHVDIFPEFENMVDEFRALLKLIPKDGLVMYCGDVPELEKLMSGFNRKAISYGLGENCDWRCTSHQRLGTMTHAEFEFQSEKFEIQTPLFGRLYLLNLLASFAMVKMTTDLSVFQIRGQVVDFSGAKRRMELLREKDFMLFSDFAHHPTAIEATIKALKEEYPHKKVVALFDPRNATSRRSIFEIQLASALSIADQIIIAPPYQDQRLSESEKLNAVALAEKIGNHALGFEDEVMFIETTLKSVPKDGIVLVMSCGSCYGILTKLESLVTS